VTLRLNSFLKVRRNNSSSPVTVRALLHDCGLAVTGRVMRNGEPMRGGECTVTHVASGGRIQFSGSIMDCWALIEELADVTDWTVSVAALKSVKGLESQVERAVCKIRSGLPAPSSSGSMVTLTDSADKEEVMLMTVEDVGKRVDAIYSCRFDSGNINDEAAHSIEDALYIEVLLAIAAGAPNAKELAVAALKSREIKFSRWCG